MKLTLDHIDCIIAKCSRALLSPEFDTEEPILCANFANQGLNRAAFSHEETIFSWCRF